jgi:DNA-binding response OmpR family regulator
MSSFFAKKWKQVQDWIKATNLKAPFIRKKALEKPSCTILCVDDDRSFCLFMQQLAYSLGIQLDMVNSLQEAKEAIKGDSSYQAFIIDGHLPDGSGFELVAWIRKKKESSLPIAFISRIYQDAASFRILKESLKVNYVLEKPIHPSEVHQLLQQICHLTSQQPVSQEPFSDELLTNLKLSYQKTIADKIERLEKMILDAQRNPSLENLHILKGEVHKIAGSAGSYGYMAVSELCKNLELDLNKQIELAKQGQFDYQWLASLDHFFTQIKLHFQIRIAEPVSQSPFETRILPAIYVVDEDQAFLTHLTQLARDLDFEILTESRPHHAIQTLLAVDFYPQILLLQAHYPIFSLTGYELIKAFYQENDELTSVIALMVETGSLEQQVEVFQRGMPLIIAKPFLPSLVLPLLDQIPFRPLPFRFKVLVIDDDLDICQYILRTLKYPGLEIKTLQDVFDLEGVLKSEQPDLVLLDINLTDESGIGILHRIRHEWGYKKILVGMLTLNHQNNDLLQQCYEANIDEILFKPLEGAILQRKIALLFKKKTEEILSAKRDIKKGLESLQTFKRYLNELHQPFQATSLKMLVLFELEGLTSLDAKEKKTILESVSQAFEDLLRKYEIAAHLGQERFALVFQDYDPHFVQFFMHHFLLRMHSHLQKHFIPTTPFSIYETLVILSKEENVSDMLQCADEFLFLTKQQPQQPVRLATDPSFIALKEVHIFHDDQQSLDALQSLFQEQGFNITSHLTFEELPPFSISLPLFILTDSFAEVKGLHLLKKLFFQTQMQIPILYLPYLPEQNYLERFLREIDYFASPFGLVILFTRTI